MQRAVRRVVHQDREPELAAAEKDDREQPRGRILRPGRKTDECEADDPGVCDEPDTAPRRGARQRRPLGAVEEAVGRQEADGRHRASVTSCEEKLKCFDCGDEARSEEHTSELQSLMRISYAVFFLKKKRMK